MNAGAERIIYPLDVPSIDDAMYYIDILDGYVGTVKVGMELFFREGPSVVHRIRERSRCRIFLDLKLHDIPATVGRAVAALADLGVDLLTVHSGESPRMMDAAVRNAPETLHILAVTLLTHVSRGDLERAGAGPETDPAAVVMARAAAAAEAGCFGVVCSGREVKTVKAAFGRRLAVVTPGIRPRWSAVSHDDQRRITTPYEAVRDGADLIVIGRPIRNAPDPRQAAVRIAGEIEEAIASRHGEHPDHGNDPDDRRQ